jgi:hypothetical protein
MTTLPEETIIWKSASGGLTLTSHRIRYQVSTGNNLTLISIMLEELASVGLVRSQNIAGLILAILSLLGGAVFAAQLRDAIPFIIGLVVAGIFIAVYFGACRTELAFQSPGASIRTQLTGMKLPEILQVIEFTDAAKNARSLLLSGK